MIIKCQLSLDLSGLPAFPHRKLVKFSSLITSHTDSIVFKDPKGLESTMQVNTGTKKIQSCLWSLPYLDWSQGMGGNMKGGTTSAGASQSNPSHHQSDHITVPMLPPMWAGTSMFRLQKKQGSSIYKDFQFQFLLIFGLPLKPCF